MPKVVKRNLAPALFSFFFILPFIWAMPHYEIDWDIFYPMGRELNLEVPTISYGPPVSPVVSMAPVAAGDSSLMDSLWIGRDTTNPTVYGTCPPTQLGKFQSVGWSKRAMCRTRNEVHAETRSYNLCNVTSLDTLPGTSGSLLWCLDEAADSEDVAWTRVAFDTGGIIGESFNDNAGSYSYGYDDYPISSNLSIVGQTARGPGIALYHGDLLNDIDDSPESNVIIMGLRSHGRQSGLHAYAVDSALFAFNSFSHALGTNEMISVGTSRYNNVDHVVDMGMLWTLYGWPDTSDSGWNGRLTQLGGVEVAVNQTWRDSSRVYAERQLYANNWSFGGGARNGFLSGDTVIRTHSVIWNWAGHSGQPSGYRGAGRRQIIDVMAKPGPSEAADNDHRKTGMGWSQVWEPTGTPPAYNDSTLDKIMAAGYRTYWSRGGSPGGDPYTTATHNETWRGLDADSINTDEQLGGPMVYCAQTLSPECVAAGDTISWGWIETDTLPTSGTPGSDWGPAGGPLYGDGLTDAEIDSIAAWVGASWGLTCDGKIAKVIDGVRRRIPFDSLRIREYYDSATSAPDRGISGEFPGGDHQVQDSIWPTITAGGTRCTDTDGDGLWDNYESALTNGVSTTSVNPTDTVTRYNHFAFEGQDWAFFSDWFTVWFNIGAAGRDSIQLFNGSTHLAVYITPPTGVLAWTPEESYEAWGIGDTIHAKVWDAGAITDSSGMIVALDTTATSLYRWSEPAAGCFSSWTITWNQLNDPAGVDGYYVYWDSAGLNNYIKLDSTLAQNDTTKTLNNRDLGGRMWGGDFVYIKPFNSEGEGTATPTDTVDVVCS